MLKDYLDDSIRPQENFFQHANGKWLAKTTIPDDESKWGTFYELREQAWKKAKDIAESASEGAKPGTDEYLVRNFYVSGMDVEKSEKAGLERIKEIFGKIDSAADKNSFMSVLGWLHGLGIYALWIPYVEPDEKNSQQYILRFHQGGLGLPDRDYYLKDDPNMKKIRQKYSEHLPAIYGFFEQSNTETALIIAIERYLAENSDTRVEQRDIERQYNKYTPQTLKEHAPEIDWETYFQNLGLDIPQELLLDQPKFMKAVESLLAAKPIDELKKYLKWQVLVICEEALGEKFEQVFFEFFGKVLEGKKELHPRWRRVVMAIDKQIGEALGKLFVAKYFPPQAKQRMEKLVEDLKAAFAERIRGLDWMEEETKKYAIYKLSKVKVKIGYPDKWRDYSGVETNPDSYFDNMLSASKWETRRQLNKLKQGIERTEWLMTPQTVNAYAYFHLNEITFPAGILQPPFFDFAADDAVNYGGIGTVIGHELTHGFDDMGSQFDDTGVLRNWRTEKDKKNFDERAAVMVSQANAFEVLPGLPINGQLTLGENIADLGGVEIAFLALQKAWQRNGKPDAIEGLSPEQRFFLNYATTEASKYREEKLREQIATDPHSPGVFRVNGILKNVPGFYAAFGVSAEDQMFLPEDKRAKIW